MISKNPYQDIEFGKRKALILDKDGEIIYENDVTFPTYFSDNAVNIVSSKYFYNNKDKDIDETDIRQMFDRVSDTITNWGIEQEYFNDDSEENSKTFNYKLKRYQIQQLFAFNSPVYFNVGTTDKPQSSACFIIDIQDDMESIANVGVIESKIFKNGSGSGMNISPLRSKFENVHNSRGYASGPISFLKVHDVFANVIRSGGSLRRSAKLVCLNIGHPDIEEFIDCKKFEEEKMKALINAGIQPRKGQELSDEVFFQNTNISVSIPDSFMKKVLDNEDWDTNFITTGDVHKTYKARELLYKIAERAWECADPGVQFYDIINKWNTCLNDGTINSSNPCLPIWAPILTPDGYKRFGKIKNKILYKGQKECSDVIETSKLEKVYELELKNGMCLYSTKNHLVKTYRGDIKVEDLKVNDLVEVNYEKVDYKHNDDEFEKGFISGYLYSEGTLYYFNSQNNMRASFSLGIAEFDLEEDLLKLLKKHIIGLNNDFSSHNQKPDTCLVLPITKKDSVKSLINIFGANSKDNFDLFQHSLSFQKGFIEAFITFDGHVLDYRYNKVVRASQSGDRGLEILKQIQLSLASFGIYCNLTISNHEKDVERNGKTYHHQTVYNLLINDVWEFNKQFNIYSSTKNDVIEQIVSIPKKHPTRLSKLKEYQPIKNLTEYSEETVYDINVPDGNHFVSSGITVHNCGEFFWLDNSSCNLASLNYLKFVKYDSQNNSYFFDFELFKDVVETVITAQDIIVDSAVYPTDKITKNTHMYRPLGLGCTNLGAMLMYLGLPYDSDEGRYVASQFSAILTGVSFLTSNKLTKIKGPFERFNSNKESYYNVLKNHDHELTKIKDTINNNFSRKLSEISGDVWNQIMELVKNEEEFRNAQVTLMMPTGTTSFLMDAQTTGTEPEFSHVKYKRLSNTDGSIMTTVSPLTRICLENLGYREIDIEDIECFIRENKPLKNCVCLDNKHKSIFDTSSCQHSDQTISYYGHIKMLAAIQPFISGGISKTINLSNNITIEDIFKCYLECWRMGLKGVTVYRDGSKNYQPLSINNTDIDSDSENDDYDEEQEFSEQISLEDIKRNERLIKHLHAKLAERKLPPERPAMIYKFSVGGVKGFLTCGLYDDGDLGEIFINISKEGSTLSGLLDCLATVVSISLQKGVPLKDLVDKMLWQKFEPYGFTTDKDIKTATSLVDFIFKYLGMKFLDKKDQIELGLLKEDEVIDKIVQSFEEDEIDEKETIDKFNNRSLLNTFAGPSCNNCGSIMIKKGNCFLCMNCGNNNGACG